MTAQEAFNAASKGGFNDLETVLAICRRRGGFFVIGGLAVNTYAGPVYFAKGFFRQMLGESTNTGGSGTIRIHTLRAAELEAFVELHELLVALERTQLDDLELAALLKLREAIDLKASGKPYTEIRVRAIDEAGNEVTDSRADSDEAASASSPGLVCGLGIFSDLRLENPQSTGRDLR
jgi:hypothetical protein